MFFLLKSIGSIILFVITSSFYILLFIYKTIVFILKVIRSLLKNRILRTPIILCIIGLLFKVNFSVISTIYFLYLAHNFALYRGIYYNIHNNIRRYFKVLKDNSSIKKLLKILPPDDIILSNISLENDERTLNIYHLAITPNGLYNIIPLSFFLDNNYTEITANKIIYDIYNETENIKKLLVDIIEEDIQLTTLVLSPENYIENTINIDNFKLIQKNQLPFIINSSSEDNSELDINNIKELIIENKAWFFDKFSMNLIYFLSNNKKMIVFFLFCPIVYCIYMIILILFSSALSILFSDISNFILDLFNSL